MLRWHRSGFRLYWWWKSRPRGGRPKVAIEVRSLIRRMSLENPPWGAPRIHGELLKLGIEVAQSTVAKYMVRRRPGGTGQTWKTFLRNHAAGIGAMDVLVVPTINFRLLSVLVILRHERQRLVSLSVTDHPTAEWIAQQITEAFPWDEAPYPSHPRSRCSLRSCRQAATCKDGHPGSPDSAALALAEWPCGEVDRLDPSGVPRSRCDLGLGPFAPCSQGLRRLLQPRSAASCFGQGCAAGSSCRAIRADHCKARTRRTSPRILPYIAVCRRANLAWTTYLVRTRRQGKFGNSSDAHDHAKASVDMAQPVMECSRTPSTLWVAGAAGLSRLRTLTPASAPMAPRADWSVAPSLRVSSTGTPLTQFAR